METLTLHNNQAVDTGDIPRLEYEAFMFTNTSLLKNHPERHCVNYFGLRKESGIMLYCCIADDTTHEIYVSSAFVGENVILPSFTAVNPNFETFEREIHENFGIRFNDHPWLKPYRFAFNRANGGWR